VTASNTPTDDTTLSTPAGFLRRFAAACYDGFLLFAVLFAATGLFHWLAGFFITTTAPQFATGDVTHELEPLAHGWLYNLYLLTVIILFYAGFWCKKGQTLGMQAWRIKLQNDTGEVIGFSTAALRVICALASGGVIGMLSIFFTPKRQAVFDLITKTYVVTLPKPAKQ